MSLKHFGRIRLAAIALAACAALTLPAWATGPAKSIDEASQAKTLLRGIRMDAQRIESHALRLEKLSASSTPAWKACDRQLNDIKPGVEVIRMRLQKLEAMKATLPAGDQNAVATSQPLFDKIVATTHQMSVLLEQKGAPSSNPALKTHSQALADAARNLAQAAG